MTHSAHPSIPKRAKRPPVAAGINWIGRGLKTVGYVRPALSIASVKADAEKQTGLSDYDGDSYMAALEPLLWGLEHEANLNQLGRMVMRGMIVSALASRLTVVDWEKSMIYLAGWIADNAARAGAIQMRLRNHSPKGIYDSSASMSALRLVHSPYPETSGRYIQSE